MKCLIVYAHPNPQSFNCAIKETIAEQLISNGHDVEIRDLYALGFDPVLKSSDFELIQQGKIAADVEQEQKHIKWAELIIVLAPIWWANLPAIFKGYIDRVFSFGFAYVMEEEGPKGLLPGKKVFIVNTSGAPNDMYEELGMHDSFNKTMDFGIFTFCGMEVIGHKYLGAVPMVSDEDRKQMLEEIKVIVSKI